MEPPRGVWASIWNFICFLPFFSGLLLLGIIKGIIMCPIICLVMATGNSAIILGLWPAHSFWTYYCIIRAKLLGPVLKLVLCICAPVFLILWPAVAIVGTIIGGAVYGFLQPIFSTFKVVGETRTSKLFHCIYDGTWSTVEGSFTVVRDFMDVCFHSYFSIMDDLQRQDPSDGQYYEIRLLYLPGAVTAGVLGFMVDMPIISVIALCKSPFMLFKGWHRLFHDLIGREGPFLETICVPFAGLAILLWPLAVIGAVLGSMASSILLGAYAGVVAYQESSLWLGLCYVVASVSIFDEYSNDILDMPEGSCFPRPCYRRKDLLLPSSSQPASLSRPDSFKNPPSRMSSLKRIDVKPLELLNSLFEECGRHGEVLVSEGLITLKDIEDAKANKNGGRVMAIGLPAYCLLQTLMWSAKSDCAGILIRDDTEITSTNRPKDIFFDMFLNPLLIIKDQIKAENLTESEEDYLRKLVLLSGDPDSLKNLIIGSPPASEHKRAELEALARRLQGIMKSISRYPTFRRRFDTLVKTLSEELAKRNGSRKRESIPRSNSAFARIFSQKSFKGRPNENRSDQDSQVGRDVDIEL